MPDPRDERIQRGTTFGVMLAAALVGVVLVAFGPDEGDPPSVSVATASGGLVTTTQPTTPPTTGPSTGPSTTAATLAPTTTTTPVDDPGALPQTDERPTASGATFTAGVDDLWEAIEQDDPARGYPFFFPKRAYLQVKAISDPAGDYQNRLIANFDEDVHTLHAQLGPNAANAQFVGITVPDDQAVLVQPGEESNQGSYWRVYGTTLQYEVDGQTRSLPVTSLISWRGQWYVVHLGAIR